MVGGATTLFSLWQIEQGRMFGIYVELYSLDSSIVSGRGA